MQRVDIDEVDFAQLQSEMIDTMTFPGDVAIVLGTHAQHGTVILVQAGGLFVAMADDASGIIPQNSQTE